MITIASTTSICKPIVRSPIGTDEPGGPGAGVDNLLLEDSFALLIETGDALVLE